MKRGIAKRLDRLSNSQFSTFLRASNHIPAQAVAATQASQAGTLESVYPSRTKYMSSQPGNTIAVAMRYYFLFVCVIGSGDSFLLRSQ